MLLKDSFQGEGLVETHSTCLESGSYGISLSAPLTSDVEIGLERIG
eukprot:gene20233-26268_t